jgi:putative transcriptional regulator
MNLIGNLIISPPSVKGNFWYKTVAMIVEHHNQGSIGIVLNKRSNYTINELGDQLDLDFDIPGYVYIGGPVNPNSISLIHSNEWSCDNTLRLNENFSLSSSKEIMRRFSNNDLPKKWRLFFGICGWPPGKLHKEINGIEPEDKNTSWCFTNSDTDLVFNHDTKVQWNKALEKAAAEFAHNILPVKIDNCFKNIK